MGREENTPESRRTTRGFAKRTRRNLELATESYAIRKDFHVITQLVNSLLGIVVVHGNAIRTKAKRTLD